MPPLGVLKSKVRRNVGHGRVEELGEEVEKFDLILEGYWNFSRDNAFRFRGCVFCAGFDGVVERYLRCTLEKAFLS